MQIKIHHVYLDGEFTRRMKIKNCLKLLNVGRKVINEFNLWYLYLILIVAPAEAEDKF